MNSSTSKITSPSSALLRAIRQERERRKRENRLQAYRPYPKQREFHNLGATVRERGFLAGNQLGKTLSGAAETAIHLTGRYPDWWAGRVFTRPVRAMAGSESSELTRDGVQRLLVGDPRDEDAWGTGYVPKSALVDWSRKSGVADALDGIVVRHGGGGDVQAGHSALNFKSFDQGRSKWQADTLDFVWFDEEPPLDVYSEGVTRTNATKGMVYGTFTPLKGMSDVVSRFLMEESPDRRVVQMTIDDAEHYTPEERARIVAGYPAHEREARAKGIPMLGSGRIFPVAEESILCDPLPIPAHWVQIVGIDFGWDHPFAACRCAWDRDADVWYVIATYAEAQVSSAIHAAAVRPWGTWIPVAWPHDGYQHDKGSGDELAAQYRAHGLNMLAEHATHESGGNGVEAGIAEMLERMQTGRFKVFRGQDDWIQEFRLYHRENGKVVKERDDRLSATRYALMMRRFAETEPNTRPRARRAGSGWMSA